MGSIIGLNYQSVQVVAELKGIWNTDVFEGLQVIEAEALRIINGKQSKSNAKNKR